MENPTVNSLLKTLKAEFEAEHGIKIDFRTHAFLKNQYGCTPIFDYDLAEKVVTFAYAWGEKIIEENQFNYPDFDGWQYNLQMECDKLRSTTLKSFLLGLCHDLVDWYEEQAKVEDFEISFFDEVEETYIVNVTHKNAYFSVNCQHYLNHNYVLTNRLSCHNESGGDFSNSGLNKYAENRLSDDDIEKLQSKIEACAEAEITIKTAKDYLENETDLVLTFVKTLAGANYANNQCIDKYEAETGEIVLADTDESQNKPSKIVKSYRVFDTEEEYEQWFDNATEDHQGHWSGDCSLAYMLKQAL